MFVPVACAAISSLVVCFIKSITCNISFSFSCQSLVPSVFVRFRNKSTSFSFLQHPFLVVTSLSWPTFSQKTTWEKKACSYYKCRLELRESPQTVSYSHTAPRRASVPFEAILWCILCRAVHCMGTCFELCRSPSSPHNGYLLTCSCALFACEWNETPAQGCSYWEIQSASLSEGAM